MNAIAPSRFFRSAYSVGLAILLVVGLTSLSALLVIIMGYYRPISLPRHYENAPLSAVIADLEAQEVIPAGTHWQSDALRKKRVNIGWFIPYDLQALQRVANEGQVAISWPSSATGQIVGPITIETPGKQGPGLFQHRPNDNVPRHITR